MSAKTPDMHAEIARIHSVFCAATGVELRLGIGEYNRQQAWFQFLKAGFNEHDVLLVCNSLKRKIAKGERLPGALRFRNLIEQLPDFEEELGMARAEQKNMKPKPTPRERVLEQARPTIVPMRPEDAQDTSKHVSHLALIQQLKQAAGMR